MAATITGNPNYTADGGEQRPLADKIYEGAVSIPDYRDVLDATDTAAFVAALATGKPVYFPAGQGTGPGGDYILYTPSDGSTGYLQAGSVVFGDGMGKSVLRPPTGNGYTIFRALSGAANQTVDYVTICDLTLYGRVEQEYFREADHLVGLNGVRNLNVQRVEFKGFRGDGLFLGSGEVEEDPERHNFEVTVRDCVFDGITGDNRNGITFMDIAGFLVDNCTFRNCTKSTMPGAIDFEPDAFAYGIVRDGTVSNCSFDNIGGNVGAIAIYSPAEVTEVARNIRIVGNRFSGCNTDIVVNVARALDADDDDMGIVISGNHGRDGDTPFKLISGKGMIIDGSNSWQDYVDVALLGFTGTTELVLDTRCDAKMIRCGGAVTDGCGIYVGKAIGLKLGGELYKCGAADVDSAAIRFLPSVASDRVQLENLRIVMNSVQVNAIEASSHSFTPANNRFINCDLGAGVNEFDWINGDLVSPALTNSWVSYGGSAPFRVLRDTESMVHITGALKSGTTTGGTTMATLPVGFRPVIGGVFAVTTDGANPAYVVIATDGTIKTLAGINNASVTFQLSFQTK